MISPRPWRWVEGGQMEPNNENRDFMGYPTELSKIVDANGKVVFDFGDSEQYYPSAGMEPNDEDRDFLIKAINSYVEKESS